MTSQQQAAYASELRQKAKSSVERKCFLCGLRTPAEFWRKLIPDHSQSKSEAFECPICHEVGPA
jgi:hypothetical protein